MSTRSYAFGLLVASLMACTSTRGNDSADASVAAIAKPVAAIDVIKQVAAHPELHLGRTSLLERRDDGYGLRKVKAFGSNVAAIDVTLPVAADGITRLSDPSRAGFTIELRPEAQHAMGEAHDGALVFPNAATDTDLVQVLEPGRYEELRVLRSPRAGSIARWHVTLGRGIASLYVRDHSVVEAYDLDGRVRLLTEPAFAIDARGVRRDVALELEDHDGDRLLIARFDDKELTYPIVLDPTWYTALGTLPGTNYFDQPWITLSDNRIVAFGTSTSIKPAIFDPTTEVWTQEAVASGAKDGGIFAQLGNGKLLIAAGSGRSTAELWAPGTSPAATGTLSSVRNQAAYVHLNKGIAGEKVIAYGGTNATGGYLTTAEEYDVATGAWSIRPTPIPVARARWTATDLGDGNVALIGGFPYTNQGILHNLTADTYTTITSTMPTNRGEHHTQRLSTGKLLIFGGSTSAYTPNVATTLYDIASKTFSSGPLMRTARYQFPYVAYGTGKWLIVGGRGGGTLSTTEIFDESTMSFTDGPPLSFANERQGVAALPDGRYITGGGIGPSSYTAQYQVLVPDPKTCTSGTECSTGFCVDGFCCNKACTGQCEACDVASRQGVCLTVAGDKPHGTRPSCGSYLYCASDGSCQTTCSADTACLSGNYCTGPGGICVAKKTNGSGCAGANECTSGYCADKVCCNAPCAGQCEACAESGSVGTCKLVDGIPRSPRLACTAPYACAGGTCATSTTGCTKDTECASSYYCNTSSACVSKLGPGVACTRGTQCSTGNCVDGYCCNTACAGTCDACDIVKGTCSPIASGGDPRSPKTCGGYKCNGASACLSACTTDAQCASDSYCGGGACYVRKANGSACGTNRECTSAICAAGICCSSACTGECESCGTGTCAPKTSGTACGIAGCIGSYTVSRGTCSGTDNTCSAGTVTECAGSLNCASATACKTSCLTTADCVRGTCDTTTGTCILTIDGGLDTGGPDTFMPDTFVPDTFMPDTLVPDAFAPDTTVEDTFMPDTVMPDTFMPDTFVPDTFVPDTAIEDTLVIADSPAPKLPAKPEVTTEFKRCNNSSECPSGFCVEGVCCNSACNQRCFSCALLNTPGTCTQEPIGVDLKNECGPALTCLGTCGGSGECIGAGNGTMCARNRCTGPSTGAGPAYCSSPGAKCNTDETVAFDCSPFVCEPAFGACRSTCTSSNDCAQGFICDAPSKTCVAAPPPPAESGDDGCAVSAPGTSRGGFALAGALVALGLLARRRRAA